MRVLYWCIYTTSGVPWPCPWVSLKKYIHRLLVFIRLQWFLEGVIGGPRYPFKQSWISPFKFKNKKENLVALCPWVTIDSGDGLLEPITLQYYRRQHIHMATVMDAKKTGKLEFCTLIYGIHRIILATYLTHQLE